MTKSMTLTWGKKIHFHVSLMAYDETKNIFIYHWGKDESNVDIGHLRGDKYRDLCNINKTQYCIESTVKVNKGVLQ